MVEIPLSWFTSQRIQVGELIKFDVTDHGVRVTRCFRVVSVDRINEIASCVEIE